MSRPTPIRHFIVFTAMLMSVLLYLDRFCVSFAADYIREDLQLTQAQIGFFLSAFFWSYALSQVPSGWLSDRYGARIMLAVYVLTWSVFTGLMGAAHSFVVLIGMRLLFGIGQAGAYPTSASVLSKWVPFKSRGLASAWVALGGRAGGAAAPVITALLIVYFVPLSVDSHLRPQDILNGPAICDALATEQSDEKPQAAPHLRTLLAENAVAVIDRGETLYKRHQELEEEQQKRLEEDPNAEVDPQVLVTPKLDAADREALVAALNGLLTDPQLYDPGFYEFVNLSRQTRKFLEDRRGGREFSEAENLRTNRLVLEAVFPGSVSKIYVRGWRPVMYVYGGIGIFVAGMIWILFRPRPETHPWCNEAEQELIASGRPAGAPSPHGKAGMVPLGRLIKSTSMWCVCVAQFGTNVGWLFIVTWLPRYLLEQHNVPIMQRATMTMTPMMFGIVGMFFGGILTDALARRMGLKWGRRLPLLMTRLTAAAGYGGCVWFSTYEIGTGFNQPWFYIGALSLAAFSTDMGTGAIWAFKQDVGGRYVGSILGWGNMWGNIGAAFSPLIYDYYLGESPATGDWNNMFLVCLVAFVCAAVAAFGIDATVPIAPPDEDEGKERGEAAE